MKGVVTSGSTKVLLRKPYMVLGELIGSMQGKCLIFCIISLPPNFQRFLRENDKLTATSAKKG